MTTERTGNARILHAVLAVVLSFCTAAVAQTGGTLPSRDVLTRGEIRATRAFNASKRLGTPELYAFLREMPKGADLHMHLGGAFYIESAMALAVKQGLCIDPRTLRIVPTVTGDDAPCGKGNQLAAEALNDQAFYDRFVDAASIRSFVPSAGFSSHDQFFGAFGHAGGLRNSTAEQLDEVAVRAAGQNEQYLEIMASPGIRNFAGLTKGLSWPDDAQTTVTRAELEYLHDAIVTPALRELIQGGIREVDKVEAAQRAMEKCDVPSAASPACRIRIHYLYSVSRSASPLQVFTSAVIGFVFASADSRYVGINILAPEDGRVSMHDYHIHMQIFDYLHSIYPKVNITLHAGELAPGLVPPEGLRFHIREAVELGHAQRIGHGVDVFYEDNAAGLVREMAAKHVMVEVNLTSNDVILGVKGRDHPLAGYRAAHVPVALSTDDEAVSRIDLTHEYVKGAEEQNLSYIDLKQMARTSLEHAFLRGQSLWAVQDDFTRRRPVCAAAIVANSKPGAGCDAFLKSNEKAAEQWELEHRFDLFEASVP